MAQMSVGNMISMQVRINEFLKLGHFDSAERLGSFLLCSTRTSDISGGEGSHCISLSLYADALFGKKEYLRALSYYKQASQRRKVGQRSASSSSSSSSPALVEPEESELKLKEAQCHIALKDVTKVCKTLWTLF
jgi:anaphase-promoting complex subunit 7